METQIEELEKSKDDHENKTKGITAMKNYFNKSNHHYLFH